MQAITRDGLTKTQVLERFGCVVGIADCSFEVPRGEIFCVMGLSGSGKSTMVRHVNRLIEPTTGRIEVLGRDVLALGEGELRKLRAAHIGMVFQHMALFPHRTVRDNVAFPLQVQGQPKSKRWEVSQRCLSLVNLDGYEDRFPSELSGGMQQRVGLARALASDPEVLLMDEPFSALDPLIRRQLQEQFMALSADLNKTTVFITHDLDEAIRIGQPHRDHEGRPDRADRHTGGDRHESHRRLRAGLRRRHLHPEARLRPYHHGADRGVPGRGRARTWAWRRGRRTTST